MSAHNLIASSLMKITSELNPLLIINNQMALDNR